MNERRRLAALRRRVGRAIAGGSADSDAARMRLELLARIGELNDLDIDTASRLDALLDAMLPDIADACAIFLIDSDELHLTGARHVDAGRQRQLADPALRGPFALGSGHPTARALRSRRPVLVTPSADRVGPQLRALGIGSLLAVPLLRYEEPMGALLLAFDPRRDPCGPDDITFAVELARRVTVSLDTGHRHEQERQVAETLQESLLPRALPRVGGLGLAGRYVAATRGVYVGGDWYDAVALGGGRLAVAIGDVAGHGLAAASAMGRLRAGMHLCMIDGLGPAAALERLNRYSFSFDEAEMATVQVGIVDCETREFRFASAGHPPPMVIAEDDAWLLDGGLGVPLLAMRDATYAEASVTLPVGGTVLLYTDGLVERRQESLGVGFDRLLEAGRRRRGRLSELLDALLDTMVPNGVDDDIAMVALRCIDPTLRFDVPAVPAELAPTRRRIGDWLDELGAERAEAQDVIVAVNEAAANVVEHAYRDGSGALQVDARIDGAQLVVSVRDQGRWRPAVASDERGRGILLMRQLMDDVTLHRGDDLRGTTVELRHRLESLR
jgi:serine phosphatase RsbU (regulator of sigma subunit)/anti-sigma regulatory factor (Ser/Thr protein kinase)